MVVRAKTKGSKFQHSSNTQAITVICPVLSIRSFSGWFPCVEPDWDQTLPICACFWYCFLDGFAFFSPTPLLPPPVTMPIVKTPTFIYNAMNVDRYPDTCIQEEFSNLKLA